MTSSRRRRSWLRRAFRTALYVLMIPSIILLVRAFDARSMPELHRWHRVPLTREFRAERHRAGMTFEDYLALEDELFAELDREIYEADKHRHPQPYNRYVRQSLSDPARFDQNWNRSFELVPENIRGGVLLLHGLTDSPYSFRTIAQIFYDHGYYVLCPRLPGHGTVPAALTATLWQDWTPVVEMATRHVRQKIGAGRSFYLGGYSNGGALAVRYALDALDNDSLDVPDKMFLFSPAIGVTRFAVLANWHKILSFIPYFEKFKWQSIEPEFDPFKYNSFPKNAGDQIYLLSKSVQHQIVRTQASGKLSQLPPMVTFQSVVDSTVVSADLVEKLYDRLGPNQSELVVFDVNRSTQLDSFFKPGYRTLISQLADGGSASYKLTVLTNASPESLEVVAKSRPPLSKQDVIEVLDLAWPRQIYSLSHVAIPFPPEDPIYGSGHETPNPNGLRIGRLEPRGERDLLNIPADQLLRLRYNPFFAYMKHRLVDWISN